MPAKKKRRQGVGAQPMRKVTVFEQKNADLPPRCVSEEKFRELVERFELSNQLRRIFDGISRDMLYADIAGKIGISISTLLVHARTLFQRCNVANRRDLVIHLGREAKFHGPTRAARRMPTVRRTPTASHLRASRARKRSPAGKGKRGGSG
jgi:hypothetical protein